MSDNFKGPFVFKKDESGHSYIVPVDKVDLFDDLLYGEPEDFEWAEDRHDLHSRFNEEFGVGSRRLPHVEFYLKED